MFSRNDSSCVASVSAISLEFIWVGKSVYPLGEYSEIALRVDDELSYRIAVPPNEIESTEATSLSFRTSDANPLPVEPNYLIVKDHDTLQKITLNVGITKPDSLKGSILIKYVRRDIAVGLDMSLFESGNHYKITYQTKGTKLHVKVEPAGLVKINPVLPLQTDPTSIFRYAIFNRSQTEFTQLKEHSQNRDEVRFFTLALERKFEEAIMYASDMSDQGLGGRMILDLLRYRGVLAIDVNKMNDNPLGQTPLHRFAIDKKWHAYFALLERGADSGLLDNSNTPAQEYRRRNGMHISDNLDLIAEIYQDLAGDVIMKDKVDTNAAPNLQSSLVP